MRSFGTLLLAAWTLLTLYVFGRAATVPWVARLIVSRGTGTWGPRLRLWYPGEIIRVTLQPGT